MAASQELDPAVWPKYVYTSGDLVGQYTLAGENLLEKNRVSAAEMRRVTNEILETNAQRMRDEAVYRREQIAEDNYRARQLEQEQQWKTEVDRDRARARGAIRKRARSPSPAAVYGSIAEMTEDSTIKNAPAASYGAAKRRRHERGESIQKELETGYWNEGSRSQQALDFRNQTLHALAEVRENKITPAETAIRGTRLQLAGVLNKLEEWEDTVQDIEDQLTEFTDDTQRTVNESYMAGAAAHDRFIDSRQEILAAGYAATHQLRSDLLLLLSDSFYDASNALDDITESYTNITKAVEDLKADIGKIPYDKPTDAALTALSDQITAGFEDFSTEIAHASEYNTTNFKSAAIDEMLDKMQAEAIKEMSNTMTEDDTLREEVENFETERDKLVQTFRDMEEKLDNAKTLLALQRDHVNEMRDWLAEMRPALANTKLEQIKVTPLRRFAAQSTGEEGEEGGSGVAYPAGPIDVDLNPLLQEVAAFRTTVVDDLIAIRRQLATTINEDTATRKLLDDLVHRVTSMSENLGGSAELPIAQNIADLRGEMLLLAKNSDPLGFLRFAAHSVQEKAQTIDAHISEIMKQAGILHDMGTNLAAVQDNPVALAGSLQQLIPELEPDIVAINSAVAKMKIAALAFDTAVEQPAELPAMLTAQQDITQANTKIGPIQAQIAAGTVPTLEIDARTADIQAAETAIETAAKQFKAAKTLFDATLSSEGQIALTATQAALDTVIAKSHTISAAVEHFKALQKTGPAPGQVSPLTDLEAAWAAANAYRTNLQSPLQIPGAATQIQQVLETLNQFTAHELHNMLMALLADIELPQPDLTHDKLTIAATSLVATQARTAEEIRQLEKTIASLSEAQYSPAISDIQQKLIQNLTTLTMQDEEAIKAATSTLADLHVGASEIQEFVKDAEDKIQTAIDTNNVGPYFERLIDIRKRQSDANNLFLTEYPTLTSKLTHETLLGKISEISQKLHLGVATVIDAFPPEDLEDPAVSTEELKYNAALQNVEQLELLFGESPNVEGFENLFKNLLDAANAYVAAINNMITTQTQKIMLKLTEDLTNLEAEVLPYGTELPQDASELLKMLRELHTRQSALETEISTLPPPVVADAVHNLQNEVVNITKSIAPYQLRGQKIRAERLAEVAQAEALQTFRDFVSSFREIWKSENDNLNQVISDYEHVKLIRQALDPITENLTIDQQKKYWETVLTLSTVLSETSEFQNRVGTLLLRVQQEQLGESETEIRTSAGPAATANTKIAELKLAATGLADDISANMKVYAEQAGKMQDLWTMYADTQLARVAAELDALQTAVLIHQTELSTELSTQATALAAELVQLNEQRIAVEKEYRIPTPEALSSFASLQTAVNNITTRISEYQVAAQTQRSVVIESELAEKKRAANRAGEKQIVENFAAVFYGVDPELRLLIAQYIVGSAVRADLPQGTSPQLETLKWEDVQKKLTPILPEALPELHKGLQSLDFPVIPGTTGWKEWITKYGELATLFISVSVQQRDPKLGAGAARSDKASRPARVLLGWYAILILQTMMAIPRLKNSKIKWTKRMWEYRDGIMNVAGDYIAELCALLADPHFSPRGQFEEFSTIWVPVLVIVEANVLAILSGIADFSRFQRPESAFETVTANQWWEKLKDIKTSRIDAVTKQSASLAVAFELNYTSEVAQIPAKELLPRKEDDTWDKDRNPDRIAALRDMFNFGMGEIRLAANLFNSLSSTDPDSVKTNEFPLETLRLCLAYNLAQLAYETSAIIKDTAVSEDRLNRIDNLIQSNKDLLDHLYAQVTQNFIPEKLGTLMSLVVLWNERLTALTVAYRSKLKSIGGLPGSLHKGENRNTNESIDQSEVRPFRVAANQQYQLFENIARGKIPWKNATIYEAESDDSDLETALAMDPWADGTAVTETVQPMMLNSETDPEVNTVLGFSPWETSDPSEDISAAPAPTRDRERPMIPIDVIDTGLTSDVPGIVRRKRASKKGK